MRQFGLLATAALGLALALAVGITWATGGYMDGALPRGIAFAREWRIRVSPQSIRVALYTDMRASIPRPPLPAQWVIDRRNGCHVHRWLGFEIGWGDAVAYGIGAVPGSPDEDQWVVKWYERTYDLAIPPWALLIACLPLAAVAASRVRRRLCRARFDSIGCCMSCGYDLRASPGRCPECGKPITSPAGANA